MEAIRNPIACEVRTRVAVPVFASPISAGFPSPADDYLDRPLDFNDLLIAHPAATFAVRVAGTSMQELGIFSGDIAIVDRAVTATDGAVVLAILDGGFTIKRYRVRGREVWLEAANREFARIPINEDTAFEVWGVVRHTIRML